MPLLGIDLGATKISFAIFSVEGAIISKKIVLLENSSGEEVGKMITVQITDLLTSSKNKRDKIDSIGISVPGIFHVDTGTVWAPNIPGWNDYPLLKEAKSVSGDIPVTIDSDRACYILGELWMGNARGCRDAVFLSVGTGIGAGILINSEILRGSNDIAGAIGWMALNLPYTNKYKSCGCFEYNASGEGLAKVTREFLMEQNDYTGELRKKPINEITSYDVFSAYENNDPLATNVINQGITYWGMAVANIVSLFNPEKIIIGGGVFGPAKRFIPSIRKEAEKWAQPISIKQVSIETSSLSGDAGVFGAAYLALQQLNNVRKTKHE
jgi:glucokinase